MIPTQNRRKGNIIEHTTYLKGNPFSFITWAVPSDPFLSVGFVFVGDKILAEA